MWTKTTLSPFATLTNEKQLLQVNLVDWLKMMVGNRKSEEVVDPKLPERPASKALKRVILVALRCVDPDAQKRPKMGNIVHMLESDELLSRNVSFKKLHIHHLNIITCIFKFIEWEERYPSFYVSNFLLPYKWFAHECRNDRKIRNLPVPSQKIVLRVER